MNKIDWTKPIQTDDGRKAFVMSDNYRKPQNPDERLVLVSILNGSDWATSILRTYDGNQPLDSEGGLGRGVIFQNAPVEEIIYQRLNTMYGGVSFSEETPDGHQVAAIKLTFADGILINAEVVKSNTLAGNVKRILEQPLT